MTTLILLFHPDLSASHANAAMARAAAAIPGCVVVDMYARHPDGRFDLDHEVAQLLRADRIVLQFPVQWYSTPPLLKAWQDEVLTRMFYIRHEQEGRRLQGTPLLLGVTAGNKPEAYAPSGINLFPLPELLRPLHATAHRCGLPWSDPFIAYRASDLDAAAAQRIADDYVAHLRRWLGATASGTA